MGVRSRRWGLGRCQADKLGQEMSKKQAVIFNRIILRSQAARFGRRRCSCVGGGGKATKLLSYGK
jgi:hypothetical protein